MEQEKGQAEPGRLAKTESFVRRENERIMKYEIHNKAAIPHVMS